MNKFEGHIHTFLFKVPVRESVEIFKRQFERFDVTKMVFLALPCEAEPGKLEFDKTDRMDNLRVMFYKSAFSPNGYAYAGLEYDKVDIKDKQAIAKELLRQAELYKSVGYDGLKMYEAHPNMRKLLYAIDDEVYNGVFDFCEKEGFPITMHIANPPDFWDADKVSDYWKARGCYFDESFVSFDGLYDELMRRLDKNPKLKLKLAHWGFLTFNKANAEKYMSYPSTSVDVCPGGDNFFEILADREYWLPFIEKYADRITYGTDCYNFEYDNEENWLKVTGYRPLLVHNFLLGSTDEKYIYIDREYTAAGVSKESAEKIFFSNMQNMLGEPKKLDYDYLIAKCEELEKEKEDDTLEKYNLWCMKKEFENKKRAEND